MPELQLHAHRAPEGHKRPGAAARLATTYSRSDTLTNTPHGPCLPTSPRDMNAQVPLPAPPAHAPPAFVMGGEDDTVVDVQAVQVG